MVVHGCCLESTKFQINIESDRNYPANCSYPDSIELILKWLNTFEAMDIMRKLNRSFTRLPGISIKIHRKRIVNAFGGCQPPDGSEVEKFHLRRRKQPGKSLTFSFHFMYTVYNVTSCILLTFSFLYRQE